MTPDELRTHEVFDDLSDDVLRWLVEVSEELVLEDGERVIRAGDPAEHMAVVLEGGLELRAARDGREVAVISYEAGSVTGLLPYSRMTHYGGDAYTVGSSRVLRLHRRHFEELVRRSPELGQRLVAVMSTRVRDFAHRQEQHEKMLALGKLSAGLAHELNNPAAAVQRATAALQQRYAGLPTLIARLSRHELTEEQVCDVDALWRAAAEGVPPDLSALEQSEREDAVADWLDAHGVPEPWLRAEAFVTAGLTVDDLERIAGRLSAAAVADAITWAEGMLAAGGLLGEIAAASRRISELIAAVKEYSHMDRAGDQQPTDVRAGLESTVTMLAHKLKRKNVRVERDYAPDLPLVPAFGGQLNQVWTNLIDNAADAVRDGGTVRIEARARKGDVYVRVVDDGSGIPEDVRSRIFEPFFTTKGVGEGSGLGLDIAHRIVEQHGGAITVESRPGRTVFEVCLPAG